MSEIYRFNSSVLVTTIVACRCFGKATTLTVGFSKTDQEGTGEALYVCDATRNVLNQYQERANITRGALFRHIRRGESHPVELTQPPLRTPYYQKASCSCRCRRIHLRAFASRRLCRFPRQRHQRCYQYQTSRLGCLKWSGRKTLKRKRTAMKHRFLYFQVVGTDDQN